MSLRHGIVGLSLSFALVGAGAMRPVVRADVIGAPAPWSPAAGLLLTGTVVTMNDAREVIANGRVLVRDGTIEAVWAGPHVPPGVDITGVSIAALGPDAVIYPGLINLHDHPPFGMLPLWSAPSSHVQELQGRPTGLEPYANRYQWSQAATAPPEYLRIVSSANLALTHPQMLDRVREVIKYREASMLLGGTTAMQGAQPNAAYDSLLARNVDNLNFARDRIENRVPSILSLTGATLAGVVSRLRSGLIDAFIVHLAEGVRDGDRRPGDSASSGAEFAALEAKGLLTDATTIVHGVGLETEHFAAMAAAPPARSDGVGDGRGAKLVWSPLSNLLLYGKTAAVYDALAAGVLVALGTDWSPTGSPNLLAELKVADIALRDPRILGSERSRVPGLSIEAHTGHARRDAELALDRLLVEMVTINAARAVRWDDQVGSIEVGKAADLVVISNPRTPASPHIPASPYRTLIDATEADVSLVLVGGAPMAGDVAVMAALKPADFETVTSADGCFVKAIDVTAPDVPLGSQSLQEITTSLVDGLRALGGDEPAAGGGPSPITNTWSYLRLHSASGVGLTDPQFANDVVIPLAGIVDGSVNLEALAAAPLFTADDHWRFTLLGGVLDEASGAPADPAPPYQPYQSNLNHVTPSGNPFAPEAFERRWYTEPSCR